MQNNLMVVDGITSVYRYGQGVARRLIEVFPDVKGCYRNVSAAELEDKDGYLAVPPLFDSSYDYHHDGYPINEETWLKNGSIHSTKWD